MGAWGHRSFENDSALDWMGDLEDGGASLVGEALDAVADASDDTYLEVDECSAALAAAELVAAALGHGEGRLTEEGVAWLQRHREEARAIGATRARQAVERVYESSELRELWDENGNDTEWHADVRELLKRLAAA
jgi:Domain of unknown function (DUF4259)